MTSSSSLPLHARPRRLLRSMIAPALVVGSLISPSNRALAQVGDTTSARAEALFVAKD